MNDIDLKLKILSNVPILLDKITVYPVSIKQIARIGYTKYNQALKIFCISKREIKNLINEDISPFEFLRVSMLFAPNIAELLSQLLVLICRDKAVFSESKQGFIIGKGLLDNSNFDKFIDIIRMMNCIYDESNSENPSNEKARMILAKRRKIKNKLMKAQNDGNDLSVPDIVSIVAVGLKIPINTVIEYNIYQLLHQFQRLIAKENYETTVLSLVHGANKNDLDLKHWTEKLNVKNTYDL